MNYTGGLCLDGMDSIPQNYKDYIYMGKNVIIKTGTILAGDGFGYNSDLSHKEHGHGIQIKDNVHIGSLCTIDRGRWRDTIIGENTKIDNMVHIAHNCIIGENCIIGVGVKILGSVEIGNNTTIWANAVIHQGVKIGNNCVIGANSYLRKDVKDGQTWYGTPAKKKRNK